MMNPTLVKERQALLALELASEGVDLRRLGFLRWLIENPDERKRMGEFGRRRVECELAWKYSVQNLLAAYERAFPKGAR